MRVHSTLSEPGAVTSSCPECGKSKWATVQSRTNFRRQALHCMECGFEVDAQVVAAAGAILRRDDGQDLHSDSATVEGA